ncbi:MAG: Na/Pi symporter [Bacteroidales bacterium]|nr:Na/Pi symporter [Bacteroidales bacterium]MDY0143461.1 Na/Pi symporter [Bacteroidales bacterium]
MIRLKISLLCFVLLSAINLSAVVIVKPQDSQIYSYSGDNQTQTVGKACNSPIRVLVTDDAGNPVKGHELIFRVIFFPENASGHQIENQIVYTDSVGLAINYFTFGDTEGDYKILVSSNEDIAANSIVYTLNARKPSWIIFLIIGLMGGLAIFLYGMQILSKGMQAAVGSKMRGVISKFTYNKYVALLSGVLLTVMVQSSTVATVMLVGFVQAGLMSFAQTLGMLLGAGIGTTITAQLIALNITDYALLIVAVGFIIMLIAKSSKFNNIGKSILGLGLLFFGMYIMSQAMFPLRSDERFLSLLIKLENPFIGILVGFLFTALIHSSAAFIGIMITIASLGFLSLEACIPLVLGTNVGTGITAILASINSSREAKRVAFAHTLFKLIGVLVFVWWIPEFAAFVRAISPDVQGTANTVETLGSTVPRQIANAHTVFSIGLTILVFPFLRFYAKIIERIIPDKLAKPSEEFQLKYISSTLTSSPAMALGLAKKETERMSSKVQKMLNLSLTPFFNKDLTILDKWQKLENEIDFLQDNINNYMISVSSQSTDKESFNDAYQIMYVANELEMIADIVNTNMRRQVEKWIKSDAKFTPEGKRELEVMLEKVLKQISRSIEVFKEFNLEKVVHIKKKHKEYDSLAEDYQILHYERLVSQNPVSLGSSGTHLELLGLLQAASRHATNISRIMLRQDKIDDK